MSKTRYERRERLRVIATEFVNRVNSSTPCAHCGGGPIEWHHPGHVAKPNHRVSSLRTQGASIERIQQEMDICLALCRSCHMIEDGRMNQFEGPYKKGVIYVEPKPCDCCSKLTKPPRRGMCVTCYNHHMGIRVRKTISYPGCFQNGLLLPSVDTVTV